MPGEAWLDQVDPMTTLQTKQIGDRTTHTLEGKTLSNGDTVELRMRGNRGWATAKIHGLPELVRVRWEGDDGQTLNATLCGDTELRWP